MQKTQKHTTTKTRNNKNQTFIKKKNVKEQTITDHFTHLWDHYCIRLIPPSFPKYTQWTHNCHIFFNCFFITILQLLLFTKRALHAKFCFLGDVSETANRQIMSPLHINSPANIKPPHTHTKTHQKNSNNNKQYKVWQYRGEKKELKKILTDKSNTCTNEMKHNNKTGKLTEKVVWIKNTEATPDRFDVKKEDCALHRGYLWI